MRPTIDLHADAFEAVHRWWRAWVERDARVIERMAAADYEERNELGHVQTIGSTRLLEIIACEGERCLITEWKLSDPSTRLFDNVVVCSYVFRLCGRRGSREFSYHGRATDVLSRKSGDWLVVSHEGVLEGSRHIG